MSGPSQYTNLSELRAQYDIIRNIYRVGPVARRIKNYVQARPCRFTNAVALGLGSFTAREPASHAESRRSSLCRLVVFNHMVDSLSNRSNTDVYALDPAFTGLDKQFLRSLGVNVLEMERPSALDEKFGQNPLDIPMQLGNNTLLFSYGVLCAYTLLNTKPKLYIGNISSSYIEKLKWRFDDSRMNPPSPDYLGGRETLVREEDRRLAVALEEFKNERFEETLVSRSEAFAPFFGFAVTNHNLRELYAYYN
jgi:hypothetical protein